MKSKPTMTLDRVLSRFGIASRTAARRAILAGRMTVNGRTVLDPETWVSPSRDKLLFDGQFLKAARKRYVLFYKPKGVITSHGDPDGRETIYEYFEREEKSSDRLKPGITAENRWLAPVGRLDKDTSGLLLLTNDTNFAEFILNPESGISRTYLVKTNALMSDEIIARLNAGVEMKRGDVAAPLSVQRREDRGKYTWLDVVLTEGKNREVRRMIEAVGFTVLKLVRTQIGPLTLEGLEVGKWRELTPAEVARLRAAGHTKRSTGKGSLAEFLAASPLRQSGLIIDRLRGKIRNPEV